MCEKLYDLQNYIISSDYLKFFLLGYCSYNIFVYYSNNKDRSNEDENEDYNNLNNKSMDCDYDSNLISWGQFTTL